MPPAVKAMRRARVRGFTLAEMVVVIAISAILGAIVMVFIVKPVEGYRLTSFRRTLVASAEAALRRMAVELRGAVPASVRVTNTGTGFAIELLPIVDGGKYNASGPTANNRLQFANDSEFNLVGCFRSPSVAPGPLAPMRLLINHRGTPGNDAYEDAGLAAGSESVITPASGMTITLSVDPGPGACGTGSNSHHISLSTPHNFKGGPSTNQRVFLVTTPVTYLCDFTTGSLTRYSGYTIQASQPTTAATLNGLPGVTRAQVAGNVSACTVNTTSANVRNYAVTSVRLALTYQGETVTLMQQTALDNSR